MSIRQTLLLAFLSVSVLSAATMTALSYARSRAALRGEIRDNLDSEAVALRRQVDALLFERVEDVHGWSGLDLMQEVRVGDVDKRLARFLDDLKTAYAGLYTSLSCVSKGRVVAASDPAMIGQPWTYEKAGLRIALQGSAVWVDARPRGASQRSLLLLHAPLRSAFGEKDLGDLYARVDWHSLQRPLESAVANRTRLALLLDRQGRILASASSLSRSTIPGGVRLTDWGTAAARPHGVVERDGAVLGLGPVLVGYARTLGYRALPDTGWRVLLVTPTAVAFRPVRALLWALTGLLLLIVSVAALLALGISKRIARPLQTLTAITGRLGAELAIEPGPVGGQAEIVELDRSFRSMLERLRQSRSELIRMSKLAAVGEMAAMLAHEVRNPLGILRSSTQILGRQPGLDAQGHEMVGFMLEECDRINGLVTDLLDSARPRPPVFAPVAPDELARRVLDLAVRPAERRDIRLSYRPSSESLLIDCDREQVVRALFNLVLNAIQVLPEGGRVWITVARRDQTLEIAVSDNGPGIAPERRAHLFEPFVTHREGGIGLGLTVVQEIVKMHQGDVAISDRPGGGARFTVQLPVRHSETGPS